MPTVVQRPLGGPSMSAHDEVRVTIGSQSANLLGTRRHAISPDQLMRHRLRQLLYLETSS